MFSEVRKRVKKVGQPPGSATYTGPKTDKEPIITIISYDADQCHKLVVHRFEDCLAEFEKSSCFIWINVDGLHQVELIKQIADYFKLHPLTVEDILNVGQRPKVEEFPHYLFATLKVITQGKAKLVNKQISLVMGEKFVLSFQEKPNILFDSLRTQLCTGPHQRLRNQGSDYLVYRFIDVIVDEYFVILEAVSDEIEKVEEAVITKAAQQNARNIYRLKRRMLLLRKAIWPLREAINHLLHINEPFISSSTHIYLRDVYDHTVQAIDTLETFRDMISGLLDMYLSGITNRMNEIMKTLTIISTIFIPITAIASFYGMNFQNLFLIDWRWGSAVIFALMLLIAIVMIIYFRKKKWI